MYTHTKLKRNNILTYMDKLRRYHYWKYVLENFPPESEFSVTSGIVQVSYEGAEAFLSHQLVPLVKGDYTNDFIITYMKAEQLLFEYAHYHNVPKVSTAQIEKIQQIGYKFNRALINKEVTQELIHTSVILHYIPLLKFHDIQEGKVTIEYEAGDKETLTTTLSVEELTLLNLLNRK